MEQFEALWSFQTEDLQAEAIADSLKRSPTRLKVEKTVELIKDRQKQYKQIEDDILAMSRKARRKANKLERKAAKLERKLRKIEKKQIKQLKKLEKQQ